MKQLYQYSDKLYEIREISESAQKENFDIKIIKNIDREHMLNTKTGEVIEKEKSDCLTHKAVEKSMLRTSRILKHELAPLLQKGEIYYITLTTRDEMDYYEFNKALDNYVDKLKYEAQKNNKDFKYAFVKESTSKYRFHAHGLIWCDEKGNMPFSKEFILKKWKYGEEYCQNIQEVNNTEKDLLSVIYYLFNYSSKDKNPKVVKKASNLKHFPANARIVKISKGLKEPEGRIIERFTPISNDILCQAKRKLPDGRDFISTFYCHEDS